MLHCKENENSSGILRILEFDVGGVQRADPQRGAPCQPQYPQHWQPPQRAEARQPSGHSHEPYVDVSARPQ